MLRVGEACGSSLSCRDVLGFKPVPVPFPASTAPFIDSFEECGKINPRPF